MRYLLDTDIASNRFKKVRSTELALKSASILAEQQFTSTITVGEMTCGALRNPGSLAKWLQNELWPNIQIVDFDFAAAETYARIRIDLERKGIRLDDADLRIAAIALSRDMVLVTGNTRHFHRVPGLKVENWL